MAIAGLKETRPVPPNSVIFSFMWVGLDRLLGLGVFKWAWVFGYVSKYLIRMDISVCESVKYPDFSKTGKFKILNIT